jgi:hypothetical protein
VRSTIDAWRSDGDVEWVRSCAADAPRVLQAAAHELAREYDATGDEAAGLAAVLALKAFIVARSAPHAPERPEKPTPDA